jgi:2-oxoglutarate ferredoxin oxidoreductase subunit beta
VALALGAEASFVARTVDVDRHHLTEVLRAAGRHPGSAFVEIYQNCNVFNDNAFITLTGKDTKASHQIRLEHGKPVIFGAQGEKCVAVEFDGTLRIGDTADVPPELVYVHDAHAESPAPAFALAHLARGPSQPTALGVFRDVRRPVYGELMEKQIADATQRFGQGDLGKLLHSGDTWDVA